MKAVTVVGLTLVFYKGFFNRTKKVIGFFLHFHSSEIIGLSKQKNYFSDLINLGQGTVMI